MVDNRNTAPQHHQKISQARRRNFSTATVQRLSLPQPQSLLRTRRKSWLTPLIAIAILLSGAGIVTGGIWLSIQLFINPDAALWQVNQLLPWAKIPLVSKEQPQTLKQIRASLQQLGKIPGEPLALETGAKTLLLPVRANGQGCQNNCEQIIQLQVYQLAASQYQQSQNNEVYYELVSQLPIEGLEESFVIAPVVDTETHNYGSTRPLPVTELRRFEGNTPGAGVWLYLWGQQVQKTNAIAYGYIIHYNPSRAHLSLMLPWTSPVGKSPQWQQFTNGGSLKLIIDRSIDLEPQLQVYQTKPSQLVLDSIQLEPLSLTEPALNTPAYHNAILIARSGLWSPAWKWLQFIKQQQNQPPWSTAAQAQTDLIWLHAQYSHSQAEKTWSSPSQEVLADLIDGRWGEGLQTFQTSPENTQEITMLLAADTGRLWNRVETALRVNPARTEVKAWGALLLGAKEGREKAIAWVKQQPQTTPANVIYIQNLLRRLAGDFSPPQSASDDSTAINGNPKSVTNIKPGV